MENTKTLRSIKDLAPKPSDAIKAMCVGLRRQSQRADFCISMGSFGDASFDMCYGCAATCAIQELAQRDLDVDTIIGVSKRADALGLSRRDMYAFEGLIDRVRRGVFGPLFEYYGMPFPPGFAHIDRRALDTREQRSDYDDKWLMYSCDWEIKLPLYEELAEQLAAAGY